MQTGVYKVLRVSEMSGWANKPWRDVVTGAIVEVRLDNSAIRDKMMTSSGYFRFLELPEDAPVPDSIARYVISWHSEFFYANGFFLEKTCNSDDYNYNIL